MIEEIFARIIDEHAMHPSHIWKCEVKVRVSSTSIRTLSSLASYRFIGYLLGLFRMHYPL